MMMDAAHEGQTTEANRLYWQTGTSVADIATQLDVSRRALYEQITPWPVDRACPRCGGPLGYPNRSARDSGEAYCTLCGRPETEAEVAADAESTAAPALASVDKRAAAPVAARAGDDNGFGGDLHDLDFSDYARVEAEAVARYRAARWAATVQRAMRIGAAAAAGAVLGAVATILVTRRA
jgi:uncharacterized Zn finger protein (UPF0148 family)